MYIFEIAFNNKLGRELDRKSLCVYRQGQIPNGKMDIKVVGGVAGWRIADAHCMHNAHGMDVCNYY